MKIVMKNKRKYILYLLVFVFGVFFLLLCLFRDNYIQVTTYHLENRVREVFMAVMDFMDAYGRLPHDIAELIDDGYISESRVICRIESLFCMKHILMPIVYKPLILDKDRSEFLLIIYFPYGYYSQKGLVLNWKKGDDFNRPLIHCYSEKDFKKILSTYSLSFDEIISVKM